jgi:hypothetical protein
MSNSLSFPGKLYVLSSRPGSRTYALYLDMRKAHNTREVMFTFHTKAGTLGSVSFPSQGAEDDEYKLTVTVKDFGEIAPANEDSSETTTSEDSIEGVVEGGEIHAKIGKERNVIVEGPVEASNADPYTFTSEGTWSFPS